MSGEFDDMQEIIDDFVMETDEVIENLDNDLVEFENSPDDLDLVNKIFRAIHTIKGAAGFLGFNKIVEVVHEAESVLNKCRNDELKVTPSINDAILKSVDVIKVLINNIRNKEEMTLDVSIVVAGLRQILDEHFPAEEEVEINVFAPHPVAEANVVTTAPAETIITPPVESGVEAASIIVPDLDMLPDSGGLMVEVRRISANQLAVELGISQPDSAPVAKVEKAVAVPAPVAEAVQPVAVAEAATPEPEPAVAVAEVTVAASAPVKVKQAAESKPKEAKKGGEQTIRVDVDRLDDVMNLVGELVLGRNRLMQIGSELEQEYEHDPRVIALIDTVAQLNMVSTDLQNSVMKTRMQPIKKVFNRFPRMVRDLSKSIGKEVDLIVEGEDTELDKSVIEAISDPMVHLVRNAIDHGLEKPEQRLATRKSRVGTITLAAYYEGNDIIIDVKDDGHGINSDIIVKKAIAKGIIQLQEVEHMSERDKLNLIFSPGFSTTEKATDISGRGVGMDVVRTNVLKLNGAINISTKVGHGTTFSIKLPLTMAIIQTLMVDVHGEYFALPLASVVETVRASVNDIQYVDQQEVIHLRQEVLPLVRLADVFDVDAKLGKVRDTASQGWMFVVVIAIAEKKVGIVVDELLGQEEVVIKSLGKFIQPLGIAGATVLGNGKITLIVDLGGLMELIEDSRGQRGTMLHKRSDAMPPTNCVLIVDDSDLQRSAQRRALEGIGYKVIEACNGKEGIKQLEAHDNVGMIVTDIIMPEMDGIEMVKTLRKREQFLSIPILALSVIEEEGQRAECMKAGIDEFHYKTDIDGVMKTVKKYVN